MFEVGKGTLDGDKGNSNFLSPDKFAHAWVKDMNALLTSGETKLLKNGKLQQEGTHVIYTTDGEPTQQIWSTKVYQVICFFKHLKENEPSIVEEPTGAKLSEAWKRIFEDRKGKHCAHTCDRKDCVQHVRLATREQNEIDKHWHYFIYHEEFGKDFVEFAQSHPKMCLFLKTYMTN